MSEKQFLFLFTFFILLIGSVDGLCGRNQVLINLQSLKQEFPLLNERYIAANNNFLMQINNQTSFNKLRIEFSLTIKGNGITITSNENLSGKSFDLSAYTSTILYATDLAPYFDADNLNFSGISKEDYLAGIPLPQGMYSICFDAKAYTSDAQYRPASTCTQLLLKVNDPPVIIMPKYNESVDVSKPYLFSWMPQHFATGITEYEFEIYEDVGVSIADLYNYYTPVYTTRTTLQSILLDNTSKYLNKNSKYICVVKVIQDENYSIPFKNNGYSKEIYFNTFVKRKKVERSTPPTSCDYPKGKVFINEIANGNGNDNDEFVELVVVGSDEPGEFVSLWGYILDDNNFNSPNCGNVKGHIRLGRCFNRVKKGTIILIYSDAPGSIHPNINPANDGYNPTTGVYQIPFSAQCINKYDTCPDYQQNDTSYTCPIYTKQKELYWYKYIPMKNAGDVIQLRDVNTSLQHALRWVTNEYGYVNSYKTLFKDQNVANTYLAFTEGNNWYETSNYTFGPFANATPGAPNSQDNEDLIDLITNASGAQPSISISCSQENDYNGPKAKVDVTGSSGPFKVTINGTSFVTNLNPIIYGPLVPGTYRINVQDTISKCMDYCDLTITCSTVGQPCNDYNDCTINDVYNANCVCVGEPSASVQFNVESSGDDSLCQYCILFDTCSYGYVAELGLDDITFADTNGTIITLNQNTPGFDFTYARYPTNWPNGAPMMQLIDDFNQYMDNQGYLGVMRYDTSEYCSPGRSLRGNSSSRMVNTGCWQSFIIDSTNLEFINVHETVYTGNNNYDGPYEVEFSAPYCYVVPDHYTITASVECEGELTYLWSTGETTPSIEIDSLGPCYSVTITCVTNGLSCQFVGTYGSNCTCIVGALCDDGDPCTGGGKYTEKCGCPEYVLPDSDGDGTCDGADLCLGHDDNEDIDEDGTPDGCDASIDCSAVTSSVTTTIVDEGRCDYCINLDGMLVNPITGVNFNQISIDALKLTKPGFGEIVFDSNSQGFSFPYCYSPLTLENFTNLETGWGIWNDGGANCDIFNSTANAYSPTNAIRLRNNSGSSNTYTSPIQIHDLHQVNLDFYIKSANNAIGDKILVEYSLDGAPYVLFNTLVFNTDYFNSNFNHVSLNFINVNNKSTVVFRLKNQFIPVATNKAAYFDDITITKTCNDMQDLVSSVNAWMTTNGYDGNAVLSNGNSFCIMQTNLRADYFSYSNGIFSGFESFDPINCIGAPFGEFGTLYTAIAECQNATYLWSNGSTEQSVLAENGHQGYSVTITCGDCDFVHTVGNPNCIVGAPCDGGECYDPTTTFINEDCQCVGELLPLYDSNNNGICDLDPSECFCNNSNYSDYNNNGICDCSEQDGDNDGICDCLDCFANPSIDYVPSGMSRKFYDYCIDLKPFVGKKLMSVIANLPNQSILLSNSIMLNGYQVFHFPYCEDAQGNACPNSKNYHKFSSDFYVWANSVGENLSFYYETPPQSCVQDFYSLRIEHTTIYSMAFNYDGMNYTPYFNGTFTGAEPYGYYVKVTFPDPTLCPDPMYEWSDPSIEGNNWPFVESTSIGYRVTVTCGDGCKYILTTPGPNDCIVGTPCDDGDACTGEGHYNNKCECVNSTHVADSDGDGICDPYDVCPGYDDHDDDDHDGIPNGCDGCKTKGYICNYANSFIPDGHCKAPHILAGIRVHDPIYNTDYDLNGVGGYFHFPYCLPYGSLPCPAWANNSIDLLFTDLQNWLDATPYGGMVEGSFDGRELKLIIRNTKLEFLDWDIYCSINNGTSATAESNSSRSPSFGSYPFNKKCGDVVPIGASCDDGQACTVNDQYNDNCECVGIFLDSDHDLVCDHDDLCPGFPDQIDYNNNNIPDGCDKGGLECNKVFIDFCEYLTKMTECPEKIMPIDLIRYQDTMIHWLALANWDIPLFNINQLKLDLAEMNDYDGDGIVNFLDPCPGVEPSNPDAPYLNFISKNERNSHGYHELSSFKDCACYQNQGNGYNFPSQEKISFLAYLLFQPLNDFLTFDDGSEMAPGCIKETGLDIDKATWESTGWLIDKTSGCKIEFMVDCDCKCTYKRLNDYNGDGLCGDTYIEIDPPCTTICTSSNPCEYATLNADCSCNFIPAPDTDGDGVCDPLDECPGIPDGGDADGDGIPLCKDSCPNIGGDIGDPCDDGNPCTYSDYITNVNGSCECVGFIIDNDYDGVGDCGDCHIMFVDPNDPTGTSVEVDRYGPFVTDCNLCYTVDCDVCQGIPDVDENGNGLPDCLEPPYYEIDCPTDIQVIPDKGIVLVFDNSNDDIQIDDLPEPIGAIAMNGSSYLLSSDYLLITNIREVGNTYEVLYNFPELEQITNYSYLGVSFANHQNCFESSSPNELTDAVCPTGISILNGQVSLLIEANANQNIDILKLAGSYSISYVNGGNTDFSMTGIASVNDVTSAAGSSFNVAIGDASSIPDFQNYAGTISVTLPNGVSCSYNGGDQLGCDNIPGSSPKPGTPCDCDPATLPPGETCECYTHFRLDNNCDCIGDKKPDTDGDGICDAQDPCIDEATDPATGLCPCPALTLVAGEEVTIVNGSDISIPFDVTDASKFSNLTITITGGPNGPINIADDGSTPSHSLALTNPFEIKNLPKGYPLTIVVTGNCMTGGNSTFELPLSPLPFDSNPGLCGIKLDDAIISTNMLLKTLAIGDTIKAYDFDVVVREAKGSYGIFTGKGYIAIPYFEKARINVNFKDIKVSNSKQLINGYININGFGLSVLGDPISDQINNIVNEIVNMLEDLSDILDQLLPLTEAAEELLATTETLVDPDKKVCIETLQNELIALKLEAEANPSDPTIIDRIKQKTVELKACIDQYNEELAMILTKLSDVVELVLPIIYNTPPAGSTICTDYQNTFGSQYTALKNAKNQALQQKADELNLLLPDNKDDVLIAESFAPTKSLLSDPQDLPDTALDPIFVSDANAYYSMEENYHYCYILDLMVNSAEKIDDESEVKTLLKLLVSVGDELGNYITNEENKSKSAQEIADDPVTQNLFIDYLKKSTQIVNYGNIKN